jgi:uncharacterized membrane protein YjdF
MRSGLPYAAVTAVGTVVGIAVGAASGRPNWPVYLAVILSGGALAAVLHARVGFSRFTLAGLVVFALGHVAGGMVPVGDGVLYEVWLLEPVVRYDNLQHAAGFGVVGRAAWEIVRRRLMAADPAVARLLIVVFAVAAGAVNEIVEWVMTLTIPGTDVGGYDNTARDLVANLLGGLAVASITARRRVAVSRRS